LNQAATGYSPTKQECRWISFSPLSIIPVSRGETNVRPWHVSAQALSWHPADRFDKRQHKPSLPAASAALQPILRTEQLATAECDPQAPRPDSRLTGR
jgi:hypothetical protein